VRLRTISAVGLAALAGGLSHAPASPAAVKNCVGAEEAGVHAAGGDGGSPTKFTRAFYAHTFTLDTSLDGVDGQQLPISIEQVCRVPKALKRQAVQLAGADGVALLSIHTSIWSGSTQLTGAAAATALDGADTAMINVRLTHPRRWGEDEDGNKIPTFTARRVTITD
jgi:hypothetical protein